MGKSRSDKDKDHSSSSSKKGSSVKPSVSQDRVDARLAHRRASVSDAHKKSAEGDRDGLLAPPRSKKDKKGSSNSSGGSSGRKRAGSDASDSGGRKRAGSDASKRKGGKESPSVPAAEKHHGIISVGALALEARTLNVKTVLLHGHAEQQGRQLALEEKFLSADKKEAARQRKQTQVRMKQREEALSKAAEQAGKASADSLVKVLLLCPKAVLVIAALREVAKRAARAAREGSSEADLEFTDRFFELGGFSALTDIAVHLALHGRDGSKRPRDRGKGADAKKSGKSSATDEEELSPYELLETLRIDGGEPLLFATLACLVNLSADSNNALDVKDALDESARIGGEADTEKERDAADINLWKSHIVAWATQLIIAQKAVDPPPSDVSEYLQEFEADMEAFQEFKEVPKQPKPLGPSPSQDQYKDFMRQRFDSESFEGKTTVLARKLRTRYSETNRGRLLIDAQGSKRARSTGFPGILVTLGDMWIDIQQNSKEYLALRKMHEEKETSQDGNGKSDKKPPIDKKKNSTGDSAASADVVLVVLRLLRHITSFGGGAKAFLSSGSCLQLISKAIDTSVWAHSADIAVARQRESLFVLAAAAHMAGQSRDASKFGHLIAESGTIMPSLIRMLMEENDSGRADELSGEDSKPFSISRTALYILDHALRDDTARSQFADNRGYSVYAHLLRLHAATLGGNPLTGAKGRVPSEFALHTSADVITLALAALVHHCLSEEHAVTALVVLPYVVYVLQSVRKHYSSHAVRDHPLPSCKACQVCAGPLLREYASLLYVFSRIPGTHDQLVSAGVAKDVMWMLKRGAEAHKNPNNDRPGILLDDDGVFFDERAVTIASRALVVTMEFINADHVQFQEILFTNNKDSGAWISQPGLLSLYKILSSATKVAHRASAVSQTRAAEANEVLGTEEEAILRQQADKGLAAVRDASSLVCLVFEAMTALSSRGAHLWRALVHTSNAKGHGYVRSVLAFVTETSENREATEIRSQEVIRQAAMYVLTLMASAPTVVDGIPVAVAFLRCPSNVPLLLRILAFITKACDDPVAKASFEKTKEIRWIHRALLVRADKTFADQSVPDAQRNQVAMLANNLVAILAYNPLVKSSSTLSNTSASSVNSSSSISLIAPGVKADELLKNYGQAISNLKYFVQEGLAGRSTESRVLSQILKASEESVESAGALANKLGLSEKKTSYLLKNTRRIMHLASALMQPDPDAGTSPSFSDLERLINETWSWAGKMVMQNQERVPAAARREKESSRRTMESLQTRENKKELREITANADSGDFDRPGRAGRSATLRGPRRSHTFADQSDAPGPSKPKPVARNQTDAMLSRRGSVAGGTVSGKSRSSGKRRSGGSTMRVRGANATKVRNDVLQRADSDASTGSSAATASAHTEESTKTVEFDAEIPSIQNCWNALEAGDRKQGKALSRALLKDIFEEASKGEAGLTLIQRQVAALDESDSLYKRTQTLSAHISGVLATVKDVVVKIVPQFKKAFSGDDADKWATKALFGEISESTMALRHALQLGELQREELAQREKQEQEKARELQALEAMQAVLPSPIEMPAEVFEAALPPSLIDTTSDAALPPSLVDTTSDATGDAALPPSLADAADDASNTSMSSVVDVDSLAAPDVTPPTLPDTAAEDSAAKGAAPKLPSGGPEKKRPRRSSSKLDKKKSGSGSSSKLLEGAKGDESSRKHRPKRHGSRDRKNDIGAATLRRGIDRADVRAREVAAQGEKNQAAKAAKVASSVPQVARANAPEPDASLPPNWREAVAPDGRVYFFHTETRATTWEKPVLQTKEASATDTSGDIDMDDVAEAVLPPPVFAENLDSTVLTAGAVLPPRLASPAGSPAHGRSVGRATPKTPPNLKAMRSGSLAKMMMGSSQTDLRSSSSDLLAMLPASPVGSPDTSFALSQDVWIKLLIEHGHECASATGSDKGEKMLRVSHSSSFVALHAAVITEVAEAVGAEEADTIVKDLQIYSRVDGNSQVDLIDGEAVWKGVLATADTASRSQSGSGVVRLTAVLPDHQVHGHADGKEEERGRPGTPEKSLSRRLLQRQHSRGLMQSPARQAPAPPTEVAPRPVTPEEAAPVPPPAPLPMMDSFGDMMEGLDDIVNFGGSTELPPRSAPLAPSLLDEIRGAKGTLDLNPVAVNEDRNTSGGLLADIRKGKKLNPTKTLTQSERRRVKAAEDGDMLSIMSAAMDKRRAALHESHETHVHHHEAEEDCESEEEMDDESEEEYDMDDWM